MSMSFYGSENAPQNVTALYEDLKKVFAADTCAPRMRKDWTKENPTLGHCSIVAFLVKELIGGKVCGIPLGDGNYHCFNVWAGLTFDLTSEQFGNQRLIYEGPEQFREIHFAKEEKRARYELLKERFLAYRAAHPRSFAYRPVRITVLKIARHGELSSLLELPQDSPCEMTEGVSFLSSGGGMPEGICPSAAETLKPFLLALSLGAKRIYGEWMKNPRSALISCNDGFRPVSFYLEALDD